MTTFKEFLMSPEPSGTYACLVPDEATMKMVGRFVFDNQILNATHISKLHTTVIYSKVYDGSLEGRPVALTATVDKIRLMPSDDGKAVIAIELHSPQIAALHKELLNDYDITHTYPDFIAHMTVTYDGGSLKDDWNMTALDKPFVFTYLRVEDLNKDWT